MSDPNRHPRPGELPEGDPSYDQPGERPGDRPLPGTPSTPDAPPYKIDEPVNSEPAGNTNEDDRTG